MPVLLARGKPDNVSRMDFLDRSTLALRTSATGSDDQRLTKWVVCHAVFAPGSNVTAGGGNQRRIRGGEQRVDANCSREPFRGTLRGSFLHPAF